MTNSIWLVVLVLIHLNCASACIKPALEALQKASYVGCYEDKSTDRDLPQRAGYGEEMTPDKCFKMCKLHKSNFIGLQRGNECWCGDAYGIHGKSDESLCSLSCAGDRKKSCGGKSQNSIYTGPFNGMGANMKLEGEDSHLQR